MIPRSVANLYGIAMTHRQLDQKFMSGQPRVRVYNPSLEQHGWYCSHTIVEIVNDDMPFLFDPVTMEINRQGLALHSAFHPVYRIQHDGTGMRMVIEAGDGVQHPAALVGDMPDTPAVADREAHGVARFELTIHIEVDRLPEVDRLQALYDGLMRAPGGVCAAAED